MLATLHCVLSMSRTPGWNRVDAPIEDPGRIACRAAGLTKADGVIKRGVRSRPEVRARERIVNPVNRPCQHASPSSQDGLATVSSSNFKPKT